MSDPVLLKLFVYGTLKRGQRNHYRFCGGVLGVEEATTRGRLYDLPYGYPALVVPGEDVRATGTADYLADARAVRDLQATATLEARPGWDVIHGELMTFGDPEERLSAIDALEGYRPGERGLYTRVLVPVTPSEAGTAVLAWAYAMKSGFGVHLPGGRWPWDKV